LPTKTESISPKHNLKKNNTIEIKTDDFRGQTYVSNFLSAYNTIKNEELVLPSDS
jgi:hypothetical protein